MAPHHLWQRAREQRVPSPHLPSPHLPSPHPRAPLFGLVAGFVPMVANAGGPAMSLFLLTSGLSVLGFPGTGAWFFPIVNAVKLPFSAGLGLITPDALALDAALAPAVIAGAALGRACVQRIDQALFTRPVLAFTALSSLNLLIRYGS
ncbi:TSUP family transporter [Streptomyces chattanoogensis]